MISTLIEMVAQKKTISFGNAATLKSTQCRAVAEKEHLESIINLP